MPCAWRLSGARVIASIPNFLIFWTVISIGCLVAATLLAYLRIIAPVRELRAALRNLARGDLRAAPLSPRGGFLAEAFGDIRRISNLLQQFERQISDEGFSLKAILSSMVEGVVITDQSQRIQLANESLQRVFGLTQSPVNRTVLEAFFNHELQRAVDQTLSDGLPRKIEISLETIAREGYTTRHLEVCACGLNPTPEARPVGSVIVFHDVTALKRLEAARREFVANVSHEFRTPLTIINGYVETLLDGAIEDRKTAERALEIMAKNGRRLTALIEDLLTLAQLDHRVPQLDFRKVNLHQVVEQVIERITPAMSARQGRVVVEWDPDATWIEADPHGMELIFENILENSVRHATKDGIVVFVRARVLGERVEIVCSDDGPGIPYTDQPHIFERFYRVRKDRSRAAGGSGLGLSIAKHAVLAHGGTIAVESVPGNGAAFKIQLPATQAKTRPEGNPLPTRPTA